MRQCFGMVSSGFRPDSTDDRTKNAVILSASEGSRILRHRCPVYGIFHPYGVQNDRWFRKSDQLSVVRGSQQDEPCGRPFLPVFACVQQKDSAESPSKAPLCKGSWHGEAVTEGLPPHPRLPAMPNVRTGHNNAHPPGKSRFFIVFLLAILPDNVYNVIITFVKETGE